jgi:catechol-2,3-dioxygenase
VAIPQWVEYYRDKNEDEKIMLEDGVDMNPLTSNLQRMLTMLTQLQYHLISELRITKETLVISRSGGAKRK